MSGVFVAMFTAVLAFGLHGKEPQMKPEELVKKHLASVADAEKLIAIQSRIMEGMGRLDQVHGTAAGSYVRLGGKASWASSGENCRLMFDFAHPSYTSDEIVYNGEALEASRPRPGAERSMLGEFLYTHKVVVLEGLLGGVLSTNWALEHLDTNGAKLKYEGVSDVSDRKLLTLRYRPRHGSRGMKIMMYFDPETFRHVATHYEVKIPGRMGRTMEESIQTTRYSYITLTETFDNFQELDGMVLPTQWRLRVSTQSASRGLIWDWMFQATGVAHNSELPQDYFAPPKSSN